MIIWLSLIVPVITCIILWVLWPRKIVWWEILIPLVVSFLFILLMKCLVEHCQTQDTEYWTGWIHTAEYLEKWTEEWDTWVSEQGHTDSKGNYHCDVPGHWEHHIAHHPPEWNIYGSNKEHYSVAQSYYKHLCQIWHNVHNDGVPAGHSNQTSWGDGKRFHTSWPNQRETMVVCTTAHSYENRIQASKSVFKFREFKPEEVKNLGLFDYPTISSHLDIPCILGDGGPTQSKADRWMQIRNAELGAAKQIRMWVVIFHSPDQQLGFDQESYWCGGNKNELILCIGVDSEYKALWAYPFSWTPKEDLKIEVREIVNLGEAIDLYPIAVKMSDLAEKGWKRKEFKDFDYLSVEPPFWAVMLTFFLTIGINVGLSFWIVLNDFEDPEIYTDHWRGQEFLKKCNDYRDKMFKSMWNKSHKQNEN